MIYFRGRAMGLDDELGMGRENKRRIKENSFFFFNFSYSYAQQDPSNRKAVVILGEKI